MHPAVDQILLGAGGTLLALATTLALFSEANRIALLLPTAVFAADWTRQFAPTVGTATVVFASYRSCSRRFWQGSSEPGSMDWARPG